jgi:hypothetical protein
MALCYSALRISGSGTMGTMVDIESRSSLASTFC